MRRLIGLLLLLAACSNGGSALVGISQTVGPAGGQVVAADGNLTLAIPAGALPADTEITVRELAPSELGPEFQGADVAAAYEFGPDGLMFQQPATVTLLLDQSPLGPGGVLQADAVVLVSDSGAGIEAAAAQELNGNADTGAMTLTCRISHFSGLVAVKGGITFEVTGVPNRMPAGNIFSATLDIRASADAKMSGNVTFAFPVTPPTTINSVFPNDSYTVAPGGSISTILGPFGCDGSGLGEFVARATFSETELFLQDVFPIADYTVAVSTGIEHEGAPRVIPVGVSAIEAMVLLQPGQFPGMADEQPRITVAGETVGDGGGAWEIVDTKTPDALPYVATPAGTTYGAIPLDGMPGVFAFGDWGAGVWPFQNDAFGPPAMVSTDNVTDATPCPNGDVMFINYTLSQITYMTLKASGWELGDTMLSLDGVVSAVELPDGAILAVTSGEGNQLRRASSLAAAAGGVGELYVAADRQSPFVLVGEVGSALRRVRALGDVAAISSYGSGIGFGGITVASRSGGAWSIAFGLVGTSSVGIDLKEKEDGNILIAATSFNANQYRVIEVEPQGTYVWDNVLDLPAECIGPGHALWLPGDLNELAISCHDSANIFITPVSTD